MTLNSPLYWIFKKIIYSVLLTNRHDKQNSIIDVINCGLPTDTNLDYLENVSSDHQRSLISDLPKLDQRPDGVPKSWDPGIQDSGH